MLPDTIHKLSREERFSYARLLAFMTRVDNELTVDEIFIFFTFFIFKLVKNNLKLRINFFKFLSFLFIMMIVINHKNPSKPVGK